MADLYFLRPCRDPDCDDGECVVPCQCGRGAYPSCGFSSCYDCFLDRRQSHIECVFCGSWHSPDFDTCFKCSPATRGRDDAGAALRQLILWRDGHQCRNCGIREGELQTDPRLVRPACPPGCGTEHNHRRACPPSCGKSHKHRSGDDPGVCPPGCHRAHAHRVKDDDGIRHAVIHIDHVVPCAKGGLADEWNLRALCGVCNVAKGSEWWPGCRHDNARTDICEAYFLIARGYFEDPDYERFRAEVEAYRATGTWDPATHASWRLVEGPDLSLVGAQ